MVSDLGKKWHDRRKIITPAFHFSILERFTEVFDRLGNTVVNKIEEFKPGEEIEIYQIAMRYALDVMCGELRLCFKSTSNKSPPSTPSRSFRFQITETAMGVSIDALSKPKSEYMRSVEKQVILLFNFRFSSQKTKHLCSKLFLLFQNFFHFAHSNV